MVGRHCEAGDVLVPDEWLPHDIRPGGLQNPAVRKGRWSMGTGRRPC